MEESDLSNISIPYVTIAEVVADDLCHSCGVCGGVCPKGVIGFDDRARPFILNSGCNRCGICVRACSGWQGQAPALPDGMSERCYLAASTDAGLLRNSASGGLVTELLLHLLKEGLIAQALVTIADPNNPARPLSILADNEADLRSSSQSRYCLFPWGLPVGELLRQSKPFAVVGTSCQLSSLEYAARMFPKLRKFMILKIGICCESNIEPAATDHLLRNRKVKPGSFERLDYRSGPWPGVMAAFGANGKEIVLSNRNRLEGAINYLKLCYGRDRCRFCSDVLCASSHIAVGDPWRRGDDGKLIHRGTDGFSAALVRSSEAAKLLEAMHATGRISLTADDTCLSVQKRQVTKAQKRMRLEIGTSYRKHTPYPQGIEKQPASCPRYGAVKSFFYTVQKIAKIEPFRSILLKLMLSPVGDWLTFWNSQRKRRKARSAT